MMNCKILAISSAGGHWVQLLRLLPLFRKENTVFITTAKTYRQQVKEFPFYTVVDATRWNKLKLIVLFIQVSFYVFILKPSVIISTGAAPGAFAVLIGRFFNIKTIWLDSIANVEEISLAGRRFGAKADLFLTQWPQLVDNDNIKYLGTIL